MKSTGIKRLRNSIKTVHVYEARERPQSESIAHKYTAIKKALLIPV